MPLWCQRTKRSNSRKVTVQGSANLIGLQVSTSRCSRNTRTKQPAKPLAFLPNSITNNNCLLQLSAATTHKPIHPLFLTAQQHFSATHSQLSYIPKHIHPPAWLPSEATHGSESTRSTRILISVREQPLLLPRS